MIECAVIIPPLLKPITPSYVAGILADIIDKCDAGVNVIDVNNLLFQHIYKSELRIYDGDNVHSIYSSNIENLLQHITPEQNHIEHISQHEYSLLKSEMQIRNIFLNKYLCMIKFRLLNIVLTNRDITAWTNSKDSIILIKMFEDFMPAIDHDLIFMSCMSMEQLYFSFLLSIYIRNHSKHTKIVIGGPYTLNLTYMEKTFLLSYVDCICLGDAELTIPDLIRSFRTGNRLTSSNGIAVINNNRYMESIIHYSDVSDVEKYVFDMKYFKDYRYFYPFHRYPILSSRECCYGKCKFCTDNGRVMHKCRVSHYESVFRSVQMASDNNYSMLEFIDDNVHPNYMRRIARYIMQNNLSVKWTASSRFYKNYLDLNLCKDLSAGGCLKLFMGIESYNQGTLDKMNKGIFAKDIIPILENLKAAGVMTHVSFLFGFPGETFEEACVTQNFIYDNIDLFDFVEINQYVNSISKKTEKIDYKIQEIINETKEKIISRKKAPTYYQVYNLLSKGIR